MHFWINKPAGRYYGFTCRRYPATPVPKTYFNRCLHGGELRSVVTPVPRLMGLGNAVGNTAGPSNVSSCRNVSRPSTRVRNENSRHGSSSLRASRLAQLHNIPNNVTDTSNNQLILPNATANGTNRGILGFSEFSDAELAGFRLRCGIWITFVVASTFVAAAKFYFGYRGPGLEILVFCGLLLLLLIACLYSIFCRVQSHGRPEHRMQEDHIAALTSATDVSVGESVRPTVPATVRQNPPPPTTVRQNPPPPPYHIAILIPPPNTTDEAPPPSYDKVMR
ncbi:uncharacterized protein LOC105189680 [Harpegnathos saltator]|uniref:Uncharacterized protein n=1 Tax=Harpegnathos saltator TaxID=610380 RepID=E2C3V6_HARSA|nr:uncharacterized protein LOC105189680 [Harpegnathos saltator]XP_011150252.1 uncharacterized protein LOC105189680 [Harpegnathos saltator]EFN77342.1 hypothetical protein EAI_14472 [Harpegnathos saltator]